ncbi:unnamed protein product, partial [Iphiclides podalirius]
MRGEDILVAPVLEQGATSRDVYLPSGLWWEEGDPERVLVGPIWIKDYPAPLDVLPYFVRAKEYVADAAFCPTITAFLVLLGAIANYIS